LVRVMQPAPGIKYDVVLPQQQQQQQQQQKQGRRRYTLEAAGAALWVERRSDTTAAAPVEAGRLPRRAAAPNVAGAASCNITASV
jgi:1,2-phenylacetyl-CoA epoxidase PaaB subunit